MLERGEAWAKIGNREWMCELVYTVSGEAEKEYEAKVKARVKELGLDDRFVFTGALDDDEKWDAYGRADLFVLPTYSENFGIVIAEALWAGVPVITTKGTPWGEIEGVGSRELGVGSREGGVGRCGWWIDLPAEGSNPSDWTALQEALMDAFSKSNTLGSNNQTFLEEMGRRGHELVARKYTWEAVVKPVVEGYARVMCQD